ncbi:hypothetical protein ACWGOE_07340 [Leucobacter chromiiresistens]
MNTPDVIDRPSWLTAHLQQIPEVVQGLRSMVVPSMEQRTEGRVSGSSEKSSPPLRVEPLDELDELYAVMWELVDELCEKTAPCFHFLRDVQSLRHRHPLVDRPAPNTVRGYRSARESVISHDTYRVTSWLIAEARTLALSHHFTDAVNELVARIERLHAMAVASVFRAYRSRPCSLCGHRAVYPEWREDGGGLAAWVCDNCEEREEVRGDE